jgi:PBSX family phage terminase large subunit
MALSTKQQEYLQNCNHRWNLKVGATGSGKSWLDYAVVIPKRLMALRGQGAAVLLGNTQGTLTRNILDPMRAIWGDALVGTISSDNTIRLFGRRVYVLGADNKKHVARLQGMTIEYAYGDEMTTWNEEVFQMLKSRLRCEHSHFDGTANPTYPQHFLKQFIDSDADVYCQTSTIDDNPALTPAFVEGLKREYAGTVYYNRFILGQWCAANGIIYAAFANSIAARDGRFLWPEGKPLNLWRVIIGVDFGGNGSQHAFVATGVLPGYAGTVGLASARVDARGADADKLAADFLAFCEGVFSAYGEIYAIFADSAEQVLINHLRSAARTSRLPWLSDRIYNSKKIEINDRIRLTSILMGGGRFWVLPQAASLTAALSAALWSDKTPGKDERLDDGTTDIDTLDAFEYTIERDFKYYLRLTQ